MTALGAPTVMDLAWLAVNMRDDEKAQWVAMTGADYDADLAARGFAAIAGPAWCLYDDATRMPLAVAGLEPQRPGVYRAWMAATPGAWVTHWRTITKVCRRTFDAMLRDGSARRIETVALASRRAAHAWYDRGLGQRYEGTLDYFYADGQPAVIYARTRAHLEATHGQ